MIHLTRLNNHPLIVNSDLIKLIESAPDTVLTLVTGEKIVVSETPEGVVQKIAEFRRQLLSGIPIPSPATPVSNPDVLKHIQTGVEES